MDKPETTISDSVKSYICDNYEKRDVLHQLEFFISEHDVPFFKYLTADTKELHIKKEKLSKYSTVIVSNVNDEVNETQTMLVNDVKTNINQLNSYLLVNDSSYFNNIDKVSSEKINLFAKYIKEEIYSLEETDANMLSKDFFNNISFTIAMEINRLLKYVCNLDVTIDDFAEDWPNLCKWLQESNSFDLIGSAVYSIVQGVIRWVGNDGINLHLSMTNNGDINCFYKYTVDRDLILTPTPALVRYRDPGLHLIKPIDRSTYDELSKIVNKTGMYYFRLFTQNRYRNDGCCIVYFNKITQEFTLFV